MSTQTIQFDAIGPIPLFPASISVLNRATQGIASEAPSGGHVSNVIIPEDAVITEIVFKRAINPSLKLANGEINWAAQTNLTAGALIKMGIVTDETKYMPTVSAVTDDLNVREYVQFQPDPPLILRPDTVPPVAPVNDIVLTAGFANITEGFVTVIIKYRTEPTSVLGSRQSTTTVL